MKNDLISRSELLTELSKTEDLPITKDEDAAPATVTRCKDCRYGLPCKLFGRDVITCTKHREEIHPMDWYCADAAKTDGEDDAK